MKSLRLSALAVALVLGACSAPSPTDPAGLAPSFDEGPGMMGSGTITSETRDGGGMIGSGNFTSETEDGGNTLGSGNGAGTGGDTTTDSDTTTQRGPGMVGSGN
jgi:hypothetical protein